MNLSHLETNGVFRVLDRVRETADDAAARNTNAMYLSTLMVMRDMDKHIKEEDSPLKVKTLIDFMYETQDSAIKAIKVFYKRIQENPRARRLHAKYVEQFRDAAYGNEALRVRVDELRKHFSARKEQRTTYHNNRIVDNFNTTQDRVQADIRRQQRDV